jgi:hypothetical protein
MTPDRIAEYLAHGRRPWSAGYAEFKYAFLRESLADDGLLGRFQEGRPLPAAYGPGLDERVVEYPWVVARLAHEGAVMDAGSTFSTPLLLDHPRLAGRPLVIYTRETDWMGLRPQVSYVFGDLRRTILKNRLFASICCISTLEHVGMAPTYDYSAARPYPAADPAAYREVFAEFRRLVVPGGQVLVTVPFGRREDHGWLQQFDPEGLRELERSWDGRVTARDFFRYRADGWHRASEEECGGCRYYDVHATPDPDPDNAAAARAVACLELRADP